MEECPPQAASLMDFKTYFAIEALIQRRTDNLDILSISSRNNIYWSEAGSRIDCLATAGLNTNQTLCLSE